MFPGGKSEPFHPSEDAIKKLRDSKKNMKEEVIDEALSHSTYNNIITAAEREHKAKMKGNVARILKDADSALSLMKHFKSKVDPKVKARHDKLKKLYKEETEMNEEILSEAAHDELVRHITRHLQSTSLKAKTSHSYEKQTGAHAHWLDHNKEINHDDLHNVLKKVAPDTTKSPHFKNEQHGTYKGHAFSVSGHGTKLHVRVHRTAADKAGIDEEVAANSVSGGGIPSLTDTSIGKKKKKYVSDYRKKK